MIGNLVTGYIPICDEGVIRVIQRGEVGHFDGAPVGVFPLSEELVDSVNSVGLDGIVCCEHYELGHFGLENNV